MPLPVRRAPTPGGWVVAPTVVVDWGPVRGTERTDLSDRLTRMFTPLGRTWTPVTAQDQPRVRFVSTEGDGDGYTLTISPEGVVVGAATSAGRFYALITLTQLLPPEARSTEAVAVAAGQIVDAPGYPWRGLMLDSSRHFQSLETLKGVLELMALHKLNRFHWHLTDDQGWRLEVPPWPKLTEIGAWRTEADGRRTGGFYTAADVRKLVAFASRRHIVIVPEIDLPGHASAALAAYPELSATGAPREVPLDWGVADGVLSLGRASVTRFTNDVLATLVDLFPGPWIHWGGDEVYRTPWMKNAESLAWMRSVGASTPDQAVAAFWNDLAQKTLAAGRVPVGWDEVASYHPPVGTVVQWWDTSPRGALALAQGYSMIDSWKEALYLDYPEIAGDGDRAPWMPVQPLGKIANAPFWPPGAPEAGRSLVVGLEAGLWTERAPEGRLGRKLFPRLALIAELAWRGISGGVPGWSSRIREHRERLEHWGVGMPPPAQ